MTKVLRKILPLLAIGLPFAAQAHHSRLEFMRSELSEIEGEVINVFWRNPHVHFQVRTDDGVTWDLESADLLSLDRRGLPRGIVEVGDRVKIAGFPSDRRDNFMDIANVLLPSGTEAIFRPRTEARWSNTYVGYEPAPSPTENVVAADGAGLFRIWQRAGGNVPEFEDLPFTEAALESQAAYDPYVDDPIIACVPPGMPRIMTYAGPHPIEFLEGENEITLKSEYFNLIRTIHMDVEADMTGRPATPLGYSVGHWDGDNTLVVTTTRISYSQIDLGQTLLGFPQSEQVEIVERFNLSETDNRLSYDVTITDPEMLTEPLVLDEYLVWRWEPETRLEDYTCVENESLFAD